MRRFFKIMYQQILVRRRMGLNSRLLFIISWDEISVLINVKNINKHFYFEAYTKKNHIIQNLCKGSIRGL